MIEQRRREETKDPQNITSRWAWVGVEEEEGQGLLDERPQPLHHQDAITMTWTDLNLNPDPTWAWTEDIEHEIESHESH